MLGIVQVLGIVLAQIWMPTLGTFCLLRRRTGLPVDQCAALALSSAPIVVAIGVFLVAAAGWQYAGWVAIAVAGGILAVGLRYRELTRELFGVPITRIWSAAALCWLAQELMVYCHGRAFWVWDWSHHYDLAMSAVGALSQGKIPLFPGQPMLLGVWAAPALAVIQDYWVFQITTVCANATVISVAYLWGARLAGSPLGGYLACAMALLCPGLTESAIFTWPKVLAASFALLALYLYAISGEQSPRGQRAAQVAAGVALAAACQAHLSTGIYAGAFFGCAAFGGWRRYPWTFLGSWGVLTVAWAATLAWRRGFAEGFGGNPYFDTGALGDVQAQWTLFLRHVQTTFIPWGWNFDSLMFGVDWEHFRSDAARQDMLLRATTDVLLPTIPVVGTAALLWGSVRRVLDRQWTAASRPDQIAAASVLVGAAAVLWVLLPAGLGVVQTGLTPLLVLLLGVAGAWSVQLPGRTLLWCLSLLYFVCARGVFLALNASPALADAANLQIKRSADLTYAFDLSPQVLPVAATVALGSALWCAATIWGSIKRHRMPTYRKM